MKLQLGEIAEIVKGNLIGDRGIEICGVVPTKKARSGDITFIFNKKYVNLLSGASPSAVIIQKNIDLDIPRIIVDNPYYALSRLLELFHPKIKPIPGISDKAFVKKGVKTGEGVSIYPFVYIEEGVVLGKGVTLYSGVSVGKGVKIGDFSTIHANVTLYSGVSLGCNVTIQSGSTIGSDGFGFYSSEDGRYNKIPQVGGVVIEDNVEIGANVCVDRGTLDDTLIKNGTKIDNLVQIAHNVSIGEDTVIAGQSGISGSCDIGSKVRMGGKVGVADHVEIANGTQLAANTGVAGDLPCGIYSGSPAIEHEKWKRIQVSLLRLPDILKKVRHMENKIKKPEEKGGKNV